MENKYLIENGYITNINHIYRTIASKIFLNTTHATRKEIFLNQSYEKILFLIYSDYVKFSKFQKNNKNMNIINSIKTKEDLYNYIEKSHDLIDNILFLSNMIHGMQIYDKSRILLTETNDLIKENASFNKLEESIIISPCSSDEILKKIKNFKNEEKLEEEKSKTNEEYFKNCIKIERKKLNFFCEIYDHLQVLKEYNHEEFSKFFKIILEKSMYVTIYNISCAKMKNESVDHDESMLCSDFLQKGINDFIDDLFMQKDDILFFLIIGNWSNYETDEYLKKSCENIEKKNSEYVKTKIFKKK